MENLRRKILLELLVTPGTVIPFVGGLSLLMLSEILGGFAAFFGLCGCLVGIGFFATNLIFNLGPITERVVKERLKQQERQQELELDALDRKLVQDRDPRDQTALRNLRSIYRSFMADVKHGRVSNVPAGMLDQINEIFRAVVHHLEQQWDIYILSTKVTGDLKDRMNAQRDEMLENIENAVANLAEVVNEVRGFRLQSEKGELQKLQERLNSQLLVAKASEKRMSEIVRDDTSRYNEYVT